jgi:glycosyltransferase involved in cell wall biosynthesis
MEIRVPRLKRWISALLWLPDDKQGFIPPAVRAGIRAHRAGADLLYTTVPPFSTHLAGLVLHRLTGMRWVIEFRDPWTDSQFRLAHQRSRWTSAIERWLERRCLSEASLVVSVTEGIQRGLITKVRGKARPEKFLVARNGISRLAPPRRSGPAAPFRIAYVGSFYHRRDPFPFLEGLADVIGERSLKPDDISIEFVGNCTEYRGVSVASKVRDLGLNPFVTIRGWIPHAEAQRLIEAADMLLFLAQDQPSQVPNKLYDYLGTGVPILAFADAGGESAWMLRQAGGHFLVTGDDRVSASKAIASAMSSTAAPAAASPELLLEWTTERQMAKLVAAVDLLSEGVVDGQSRSVAARSTI